jgi:hypothetical protein
MAVGLACLATSPAPVRADGDPASDVLLVQDVFYPYQPPVSAPVRRALDETVARAKRLGFPVKVALIGSPQDLGAVPTLFGTPQRYADFLDEEIAYSTYPRLIVVMPQGVGLSHVGPRTAVTGVTVSSGPDGLARAAVTAVVKLAARAGKRLPIPAVSAAGGGGSSSPTGPIVAAAVAAVLFLSAAFVLVRRARGRTKPAGYEFERD